MVLIGAALVFFMQCGFAMVETGFTRAKKCRKHYYENLMDFCIGTPMFLLLGFGLMMGEEVLGGFCGLPTLGIFKEYSDFNWSNFVFNLVFVQQQQQSFQVQWLKEQNSVLTAFTVQLSVHLFIRLKRAGFE